MDSFEKLFSYHDKNKLLRTADNIKIVAQKLSRLLQEFSSLAIKICWNIISSLTHERHIDERLCTKYFDVNIILIVKLFQMAWFTQWNF